MGLKLSDFILDAKIYIDANIFLYSAFKHPKFGEVCINFLMRVDEKKNGYVSDITLNEVFHKLMLAEIGRTFKIKTWDAVKYIKRHPEAISKLEILWEEMEIIKNSHLNFISTEKVFPGFVEISHRFNLLATDAMIAMIMEKNNIKNIATNDSDFERVDFLKVWKP